METLWSLVMIERDLYHVGKRYSKKSYEFSGNLQIITFGLFHEKFFSKSVKMLKQLLPRGPENECCYWCQ